MVSPTTQPAETPRSQRERQRLETRELLFELAIREFRRVGTSRARVRDIADEAGVVPGTFYFHFPTKDHVIHELWLRNSSQTLEIIENGSGGSRTRSMAGWLRRFGNALIAVEARLGDPELIRDSIAIVLRPPAGADLGANPLRTWIEALLSKAQERDEIAEELTPRELAGVLLSSVLGALATASDDPVERRRDLQRTLDFFVKALR